MKHPKHIVAGAALVTCGNDILLVKSPRRGWEIPGGQVEFFDTLRKSEFVFCACTISKLLQASPELNKLS